MKPKEKIDNYCIIIEWFNNRELAELELLNTKNFRGYYELFAI